VDLSHPGGHGINNAIPSHLCSLSYITVDDASYPILQTGQGILLVKVDIKSVFCLLPADRHLLGMKWKRSIYIDTYFPFGLHSTSRLFNILAGLLPWSAQQNGVSFIVDDFLTMGPPRSEKCREILHILQ